MTSPIQPPPTQGNDVSSRESNNGDGTQVADYSQGPTARIQRLIDWVRSQNGYLHPDVGIWYSQAEGYYVQVMEGKSIAARTRIASCPIACSLSVLNALDIEPFSCHGQKFPDQFLQQFINQPEVIQTFFLVEQLLLGKNSWWTSYIESLPTVDNINDLQYESERDLERIKGTNLEAGYNDLMEKWRGYYTGGMKVLQALHWPSETSSKCTWQLFRWAATIFGSRGFASSVLSETAVSEQARLGGRHGIPEPPFTKKLFTDHFSVLLPLMDVLNHKPLAAVDWQPRTTYVGLQVNTAYKEGEQIYNNYGPRDNESLLLSYGFILADNPFKHVQVSLKAPPESAMRHIRSWPPDPRSSPSFRTFLLDMNHYSTKSAACLESALLSYDLLDSVSALAANSREASFMNASRRTIMSWCLQKPHSFEDFRLLLNSLAQIALICMAGFKKLRVTKPVNKPAKGDKQKNVDRYRQEALEIYAVALSVCKYILYRASLHDDSHSHDRMTKNLEFSGGEYAMKRMEILFSRHDIITRPGELVSIPALFDMLAPETRSNARQLIERLEPYYEKRYPAPQLQQMFMLSRMALILSIARHSSIRGLNMAPRLTAWLQDMLGQYPAEPDSWAYVPGPGPWAPDDEPPTALVELLAARDKYMKERENPAPMPSCFHARVNKNHDSFVEFLKPEDLCWAFNIMCEEKVDVPRIVGWLARGQKEYEPALVREEESVTDLMLYMRLED